MSFQGESKSAIIQYAKHNKNDPGNVYTIEPLLLLLPLTISIIINSNS